MHVQQALGIGCLKLGQHGLGNGAFLSFKRFFEAPVQITSAWLLAQRQYRWDFRGMDAAQKEQQVDLRGVLLQ